MSGSKLETCKQAIIKLIDRIQENDLLHLILYGKKYCSVLTLLLIYLFFFQF